MVDWHHRSDLAKVDSNLFELHGHNGEHSYRVITSSAASEIAVTAFRLPEPNEDRNDVTFGRAVVEVYLTEDMRRLCGLPMIPSLVYRVMGAPAGSPYQKGKTYADADLEFIVQPSRRDEASNQWRKDHFLEELESKVASCRRAPFGI